MLISINENQQAIVRFSENYIKRNPKEFLNPKKDTAFKDKNACIIYKSIEDYWKNVLTLSKSTFMKGWMPAIISPKRPDLYTQLLYHYFDYPLEIKKALSRSKRQLQWFPPQWFQQCQPLSPSGRMGQVYTSQCRIPGSSKPKHCILREVNLCMLSQGDIESMIPDYIDGITATLHHHERKLAFVSIRSNDTITLEQLIPQVDQWSLQKLYRVALSLCSTVRNFHAQNKVHPNLQPKNILICSNTINNTNSDSQQLKHTLSESRRRSSTLVSSDNDSIELIDYWTSLPLCSHYGRYPYIAPELYIDVSNTSMTQKSNIYSLGIILWQLACGVIFPTSIHISSALYQLTACRHCLPPEYGDLIARCLNPNPSKRPSAEQLCECLLRLLMTELVVCPTPRQLQEERVNCIRECQLGIAKYLVKNGASKHDIENLLSQASITKRMALHIVVSLEKHNLYWHPKTKTDDAGIEKRRSSSTNSNSNSDGSYCYYTHDSSTPSDLADYKTYHCRADKSSSAEVDVVINTPHDCCTAATTKAVPTTTTTKTTVLAASNTPAKKRFRCNNNKTTRKTYGISNNSIYYTSTECSIYGADLPSLMQMGFV